MRKKNLGNNKTTLFEAPIFVVRKITMPFLFVLIAVFFYFIASLMKEKNDITLIWFDSAMSFILLLLFPIAALISSTILFSIRIKRYKTRFKRLNGRVCFVCNYEIDKTLDQCSECGNDWSLKGLNAEWMKLANPDQY